MAWLRRCGASQVRHLGGCVLCGVLYMADKFIRKDKFGNVNVGSGFFKLHFGLMGGMILVGAIAVGVFVIYGILFGEGTA